jgi:hypothetical protein
MPLFADLSAADLAHSDEVENQRQSIEEEDAKDRAKERRVCSPTSFHLARRGPYLEQNEDEDEDYEHQSSQDSWYSSSQSAGAASSQPRGSTCVDQTREGEEGGNDVDGEDFVRGGSVHEPSVSDSEPDEEEECAFEVAYPEHVLPSSQPQPEDGTYRLHSRKVADLDYVEHDEDEEEEEKEEEKE